MKNPYPCQASSWRCKKYKSWNSFSRALEKRKTPFYMQHYQNSSGVPPPSWKRLGLVWQLRLRKTFVARQITVMFGQELEAGQKHWCSTTSRTNIWIRTSTGTNTDYVQFRPLSFYCFGLFLTLQVMILLCHNTASPPQLSIFGNFYLSLGTGTTSTSRLTVLKTPCSAAIRPFDGCF